MTTTYIKYPGHDIVKDVAVARKTITLLPCPFCGEEAGFGMCIMPGQEHVFVCCNDCMASSDTLMGGINHYTPAEAAELWNRRIQTTMESRT